MAAALSLSPCDLLAQVSLRVGGAVVLPLGAYGDVTDLGAQFSSGGTLELGGGALVGIDAFYARNPHRIADNRSTLYGLTVFAGYELAHVSAWTVSGWGGLGGLVHARSSDTYPGLDARRHGLSMTAGARLSRSLGRVGVYLGAYYLRGFGEINSSAYPTELTTLGGGLTLPLGMD